MFGHELPDTGDAALVRGSHKGEFLCRKSELEEPSSVVVDHVVVPLGHGMANHGNLALVQAAALVKTNLFGIGEGRRVGQIDFRGAGLHKHVHNAASLRVGKALRRHDHGAVGLAQHLEPFSDFRPENGMRVVLTGRVSVFERDGQYQLYAESLIPAGEGALAIAFAQLREKLAKEGLFDDTRKKPIPRFPHKIGVVTAKSGAAVRDILQILNRRWPMAQVVLSPVLVQGAGAAASIAAALKQLNLAGQCDVLIVGRGGGSMEDLWAFNEEIVVRAVADSVIPVISAVGHETDFTLCDFAADLRAPTPSAAAELAVPNQTEIAETIASLRFALRREMDGYLSSRQYALSLLSPQANRRRILNTIDNQTQYCDSLQTRLQTAVSHRRDAAQNTFGEAVSRLEALSPLKVLSRGYALCEKEGAAVDSIQKLPIAK